MNARIRYIKAVYWLGAVLDFFILIPMLFPGTGRAVFGIEGFTPGTGYRYAMYTGAALMAGWTALLVWGVMRPLERRGILLLTAVPVLPGLAGATIYASVSGFFPRLTAVLTLALQAVLIILFLIAYIRAGRERGAVRAG